MARRRENAKNSHLKPTARKSAPSKAVVFTSQAARNGNAQPVRDVGFTPYIEDDDLRERLIHYRCRIASLHSLVVNESFKGFGSLDRAIYFLAGARNEIGKLTAPLQEGLAQKAGEEAPTNVNEVESETEDHREAQQCERRSLGGLVDGGAAADISAVTDRLATRRPTATARKTTKTRRSATEPVEAPPKKKPKINPPPELDAAGTSTLGTRRSSRPKCNANANKFHGSPSLPRISNASQEKLETDPPKGLEIMGTSKMGNPEAGDGPSLVEYQDEKGKWYSVTGCAGIPGWAVAERMHRG